MIGRHLRITGRVQGVGYRFWFLTRAESLGEGKPTIPQR
jgi:acylphosphatase